MASVSVINSSRGLKNRETIIQISETTTERVWHAGVMRPDALGFRRAAVSEILKDFYLLLKALHGCGKRNAHKMAGQRFGALLSSCLVITWLVVSTTTENQVPEIGKSIEIIAV